MLSLLTLATLLILIVTYTFMYMIRALVYDGLQELYGISVVVGLYMTGWDGSYPLDCYDCKSTCSGKK